jgi:hypothetical protein
MAFPSTNPIDAGWLPRNIPIDHLGSTNFDCPVCAEPTNAEQFKIVVGGNIGFGAPFFVAPFLKRRSTKGKVGGTRVTVNQCRNCTSMFAADISAREWFESSGVPDGVMSDASTLRLVNNRLGAAEQSAADQTTDRSSPTRARKIDD